MMPPLPPSATSRTTSGVGRLMSTISATEATSAGEAASSAPRATRGLRRLFRQVVDAQPIARIEQAGGHRTAHAPDADEAQQSISHGRSSSSFSWYRYHPIGSAE